jgi:hypothetical protein
VFLEPIICKNARDLKNSSGAYLKTACTVYLQYNQADARAACISYGMQLFKLKTAEDEVALLAYADSQWPYNSLWVEGGNANLCNTITNYNRTKFERLQVPCVTSSNNFFCEYKSKQKLLKINKLTQTKISADTPNINAYLEPVEGKDHIKTRETR